MPHPYRYRDYVIRALNADLPYDQFVIEHVAGDLLDPPRRHPTEHFNESIIATGSFFFGEAKHSPVDVRQDEADRIDNQIDVLAKTFLGLTVSCARCHDHKFDAISTKDYYALAGYLQSSRYQQAFIDAPEDQATPIAEIEKLSAERSQICRDFVRAVVAATYRCVDGGAAVLANRSELHGPQCRRRFLSRSQRLAQSSGDDSSRHVRRSAREDRGRDEGFAEIGWRRTELSSPISLRAVMRRG